MARDFGKSKRAEEFRKAISDAGMHLEAGDVMAQKLDISHTYFRQLWKGSNPLSAPIRHKLEALIAAKANGPGFTPTDPDPPKFVEQVEVDMAAPQPMPRRTKYQVIKVFDGYAVVENPIAVFRGLSWAEEYAHWLNDPINRGKEGD